MKALAEKVSFKLKKNKTDTEKVIFLNEKYSANIRQIYNMLHSQNKLPKHKLIPNFLSELTLLNENIKEERHLYKPYVNHQLQAFLRQRGLSNSDSLISIYEEKQNQICGLTQKLNSKKIVKQKQNQFSDKLQTIELLKKHLDNQKAKRISSFSKIQKIKEQLEIQTRSLIQTKINNFDQEIQFRKLQKAYQLPQ